jgi:carbohydrate diacid regulator
VVAQRIIDRVSDGLRLPVSVTDGEALVVASSEPRFVGATPPGAARLLAVAGADDGGAAPDDARPLVYAGSTVGAIVLHGAAPESPVLHVARTLAELIIHQLVVLDQLPRRRWAHDKFLDDLLTGRLEGDAAGVLHQAAALGVDLELPRRVALVDVAGLQPPPPQPSALPEIDRQRRVEAERAQLVERAHALVATRAGDLCACLGGRWLAILPVAGPGPPGGLPALEAGLEALLAELAETHQMETQAGVGRQYEGWAGLHRSFRDACFALEVGQGLGGRERVFYVEALGLAGMVCRDDPLAKGELARRILAPLANEPELLETLSVFLRVELSPSLAARELCIHRHTLSYRLDKLAALTGLDPRRFSAAAQLQAAMLLQRMRADEPQNSTSSQ